MLQSTIFDQSSEQEPMPAQRTRQHKKRHSHDWYIERPWSVELILKAERFVGTIWDPACGIGTIPKVFAAAGYQVHGSDLIDRGYGAGGTDFLSVTDVIHDNIVTNPPFSVAEDFIRHALKLARFKVAALLPASFPYSKKRFLFFTQDCPPAREYRLSSRQSMPPGDLLMAGKIKPTGGKTDSLWMVWDHDHRGPTTAHWLCRGKS